MADAPVIVWTKVDGQQKFRDASRRLRSAGRGDLQRRMTKAVRTEGGPALAAVRQAFLSIEVQSLPPNDRSGHARPDKDTGLRRRAARAARIAVRQNGIAIVVPGARVDPRYPSLAFYLNGMPRARNWRHPVFGHRQVWVAQRGQEVIPAVPRQFAPRWRKGILDAVADTIAEIER